LFWAHPRANLPYRQDGPRTGLYACIFFACGKKGYHSNPLRVPKSGVLPDFGIGNSGIHAAGPGTLFQGHDKKLFRLRTFGSIRLRDKNP
jgi:hypothetical protein